ncbi:MAG: hypothetical protein QM666_00970 [Acinetobacter sp.]
MSFITVADADEILGSDFAPTGDKARLVLQANTWMKKQLGFLPEQIHENLKTAASEIIKGVLAGEIYNGEAQLLKSKSVEADGVKSSKTFQDGSKSISKYEQFALDLIASVDIDDSHYGIGIPLIRV